MEIEKRTINNFEKKIQKGMTNGCWLWKGAIHANGKYGVFGYKGKTYLAHRFSFLIFNGEIKQNENVYHKCDNPFCVNPDHLTIRHVEQYNKVNKSNKNYKSFNSKYDNKREKYLEKQLVYLKEKIEKLENKIKELGG